MINDTGIKFYGSEELRKIELDLAFSRLVLALAFIRDEPTRSIELLESAIQEFKILLGDPPA